MNKEEYLKYLTWRSEEHDKWAERLSHDPDNVMSHRSAAWAFRVARSKAEELDV